MNATEMILTKQASVRPRSASAAWIDALAATASIARHPRRLLCHVIEDLAVSHGSAPALLSDMECFSFAELTGRIDCYARWAIGNGMGRGERVALMMSNRPEFVAAWMGLSKAGIVTALINTNLAGRPLAHCLELASPSHVIVEARYLDKYYACRPSWGTQSLAPVVWCHGEPSRHCNRIDIELAGVNHGTALRFPELSIDDPALLIYTSGTTGLPKAAHVSHRRMLDWAFWFKGLLGNTEADRMYDCLPLYHSVGGVVAVAATLVAGGSTVIAERFSASAFWADIHRWNCTQFQYIGELCRYLLNAPGCAGGPPHRLRAVCGNGLGADVWTAFQERFGIPQIVEFYAATEGNFSLFNAEGKPGAIGRVPAYLRHRFPTAIVKFDGENGAPLRNAEGFCMAAAAGEAGEAIGRIGDANEASGRFEGYTDRDASEAKILRDVFVRGDAWFRTGDLMRNDAAGYYYFVDRIGDTFRWKGENVSALEAEGILLSVPGVRDAVVYGVPVPGAEGKAGMALLEVDDAFDFEMFLRLARARLPGYAVPVFLRLGKAAAVTETFKHKKQDLVRDGFNPATASDAVYALLSGESRYRRIDPGLHAEIILGGMRW